MSDNSFTRVLQDSPPVFQTPIFKDLFNILLGAVSFITTLAFSIEGCARGKARAKRHEAVFVMSTIGSAIYLAAFLLHFMTRLGLLSKINILMQVVFIYLPHISYAFLFLVIGTFVHVTGSVGLRSSGHKKRAVAMSTITLLLCVLGFLVVVAYVVFSLHPLFMNQTAILTLLANVYLQYAFLAIMIIISIDFLGNACGFRAAFGGFTAIIVSLAVFWFFIACECCLYIVSFMIQDLDLPEAIQKIFAGGMLSALYISTYPDLVSYVVIMVAEVPSILILLGTAAVARSQMKHESLFKDSKKKGKKAKTAVEETNDIENQALVHSQVNIAITEIEKTEAAPARGAFTPVKINISGDRKKQIAANQAAAVAF